MLNTDSLRAPRGVRRRTAVALVSPVPDEVSESAMRERVGVVVAERVLEKIVVDGPECESPNIEFEEGPRRERVDATTSVPVSELNVEYKPCVGARVELEVSRAPSVSEAPDVE